jgi:hypothetical protein
VLSIVDRIETDLSLSIETQDASTLTQLVSSTALELNSVDCTGAPFTCESILHRHVCNAEANTCGDCKTGYIGIAGSSNSVCLLPGSSQYQLQIRGVGNCTVHSQCMSGNCSASGVCAAQSSKICPDLCSGRGNCVAYGYYNQIADSCEANNPHCAVRCDCDSGYFGNDCSLATKDRAIHMAIRHSLCKSLYESMSFEDVSGPDVVSTRANLAGSILADIGRVDKDGFMVS